MLLALPDNWFVKNFQLPTPTSKSRSTIWNTTAGFIHRIQFVEKLFFRSEWHNLWATSAIEATCG
ncbi:hypothetical protein BDB00DRAFT_823782, partial [Zychaea mexicana]|uniref:uncharacterized protein n=1 Tax=Zychaea mexicana TaxID=64656 RepID=UPI0022FE454C